MMAAMLLLTFLLPLLLLCFATASVFAQGEATETECVFKVGEKYFDLRPISSSDSIITQNEFYKQQLNPCKPINISNGGTVCPAGTLDCQLNAGTNTPSYLLANTIDLDSMSYDGITLSIRYTGGAYCPNLQTYRQATIKFTCGTTTGTPVWVSETSCAHTLTWASSAACPLPELPPEDDCVFSVNYARFDLRPISFDTIMVQNEYYLQQLNPCRPITLSNSSAVCPPGTLNCQLYTTTKTPAYLLANAIDRKSITYDGVALYITYTGGNYCPSPQTYRQVTIKFTCGATRGTPVYGSEVDCSHTLTWESYAGCPLPIKS